MDASRGRSFDGRRGGAGDDDLDARLAVGPRAGEGYEPGRPRSALHGQHRQSAPRDLAAEQADGVGLADQRGEPADHRRGTGVLHGRTEGRTVDAIEQLPVEGVTLPGVRGLAEPGEKLVDVGLRECAHHLHRRRPHVAEQLVARRAHGAGS